MKKRCWREREQQKKAVQPGEMQCCQRHHACFLCLSHCLTQQCQSYFSAGMEAQRHSSQYCRHFPVVQAIYLNKPLFKQEKNQNISAVGAHSSHISPYSQKSCVSSVKMWLLQKAMHWSSWRWGHMWWATWNMLAALLCKTRKPKWVGLTFKNKDKKSVWSVKIPFHNQKYPTANESAMSATVSELILPRSITGAARADSPATWREKVVLPPHTTYLSAPTAKKHLFQIPTFPHCLIKTKHQAGTEELQLVLILKDVLGSNHEKSTSKTTVNRESKPWDSLFKQGWQMKWVKPR